MKNIIILLFILTSTQLSALVMKGNDLNGNPCGLFYMSEARKILFYTYYSNFILKMELNVPFIEEDQFLIDREDLITSEMFSYNYYSYTTTDLLDKETVIGVQVDKDFKNISEFTYFKRDGEQSEDTVCEFKSP